MPIDYLWHRLMVSSFSLIVPLLYQDRISSSIKFPQTRTFLEPQGIYISLSTVGKKLEKLKEAVLPRPTGKSVAGMSNTGKTRTI